MWTWDSLTDDGANREGGSANFTSSAGGGGVSDCDGLVLDRNHKSKGAKGVGERGLPGLPAFPVDCGVEVDSGVERNRELRRDDLAHRECQRNLVAKTVKWGVLGGTKDVDLWFVGPDCGNRGVGGTRVEGGDEQEFGLRGSADDERCKDEEGQGRAQINSV
jgi:hypothetical protein